MPLQNRVLPTGEIVAIPARGMFVGNRGIIHNPATKTLLKKRWSTDAWLTCVLEFRGRRRKVMQRQSWTELFFLDEATSLAAGHRPCFYCRREDANRFRAAWEKGNRVSEVLAPDMDAVLHRERFASAKKLHPLPRALDKLPDGAGGRREFSDRTGKAAVVVAFRLSRGEGRHQGCEAVDAAFDRACICGRISAGDASECVSYSFTPCGGGLGRG